VKKRTASIVVSEPPDVARAKKLPTPRPGVPINVPLMLLPTYLELHGRKPNGYREVYNVLLVKKVNG